MRITGYGGFIKNNKAQLFYPFFMATIEKIYLQRFLEKFIESNFYLPFANHWYRLVKTQLIEIVPTTNKGILCK